jgi:hypothetical protein
MPCYLQDLQGHNLDEVRAVQEPWRVRKSGEGEGGIIWGGEGGVSTITTNAKTAGVCIPSMARYSVKRHSRVVSTTFGSM